MSSYDKKVRSFFLYFLVALSSLSDSSFASEFLSLELSCLGFQKQEFFPLKEDSPPSTPRSSSKTLKFLRVPNEIILKNIFPLLDYKSCSTLGATCWTLQDIFQQHLTLKRKDSVLSWSVDKEKGPLKNTTCLRSLLESGFSHISIENLENFRGFLHPTTLTPSMEQLKRFSHLQHLSLFNSPFHNRFSAFEFLTFLPACQNLTKLDLGSSSFQNINHFITLSHSFRGVPQLTHLSLNLEPSTNPRKESLLLEELGRGFRFLKNLKVLVLSGDPIIGELFYTLNRLSPPKSSLDKKIFPFLESLLVNVYPSPAKESQKNYNRKQDEIIYFMLQLEKLKNFFIHTGFNQGLYYLASFSQENPDSAYPLESITFSSPFRREDFSYFSNCLLDKKQFPSLSQILIPSTNLLYRKESENFKFFMEYLNKIQVLDSEDPYWGFLYHQEKEKFIF